MSARIRVVAYGCGVMGCRIAKALLEKEGFELVGAIDVNPKLSGKDLGEVLELGRKLGVAVEPDAGGLLGRVKADAVVHATTSHFEKVLPQIGPCLEAGLDVVSTCEELSYPWKRHPELSRRLDEQARRAGATVVGTGINPGYLMDTLPLVLTAPCLKVKSIHVARMMNSTRRRIPFQEKVGTGLTRAEFVERIEKGTITGHVGLLESIHLIAAALGWELEGVTELPPEPVIAEKEARTGMGAVAKGKVIGLKSVAWALRGGEKAITLEFWAHAAVGEEYDEVVVRGEPDLRQRIAGGVHGDTGTVAMIINTIPLAVAAEPGLKTMKDLPLPRFAR